MKITTERVIKINRRLGGNLRSDSSLRFAEAQCRFIKSRYRCASIWVRAIAVDHPFDDANKRTTMYVIRRHFKIKKPLRMANAIQRIASNNIANISKIEEILKNANRQSDI